MNVLLSNLKQVQEYLEISSGQVEKLIGRVSTDNLWSGKETDIFLAYLQLMHAYHKTFTGSGKENPLQQAIDALTEFGNEVDSFYEDFPEYKDLEGMK